MDFWKNLESNLPMTLTSFTLDAFSYMSIALMFSNWSSFIVGN